MDLFRRVSLVVFLLFLGVAIVLVGRAYMAMQTEGLLVGMLFAPLVAYALLYGSLRELGGFGLTAKFGEAAKESIKPDFGHIEPAAGDLQTVGEKGPGAIPQMIAHYRLNEANPIVMLVKLGRGDYSRRETHSFVVGLSQYRSFKVVIFLDSAGKVFAYMPAWAARQVLNDPARGDPFLSIVNGDGNYQALFDYRPVVRETIKRTDNNATALRKMANLNLDAIVVVDNDQHLVGVEDRERVINRIMLKLVER
jgi:hypothetical protein